MFAARWGQAACVATWLDTYCDQVIIRLSLLLGLWLAGNSLYYLA